VGDACDEIEAAFFASATPCLNLSRVSPSRSFTQNFIASLRSRTTFWHRITNPFAPAPSLDCGLSSRGNGSKVPPNQTPSGEILRSNSVRLPFTGVFPASQISCRTRCRMQLSRILSRLIAFYPASDQDWYVRCERLYSLHVRAFHLPADLARAREIVRADAGRAFPQYTTPLQHMSNSSRASDDDASLIDRFHC
jgi:hypothetical protein